MGESYIFLHRIYQLPATSSLADMLAKHGIFTIFVPLQKHSLLSFSENETGSFVVAGHHKLEEECFERYEQRPYKKLRTF